MGLKLGKVFKKVLPIAATAVGTYFGGPAGGAAAGTAAGAATGESGSDSGSPWSSLVNGAVGLGQDFLSANIASSFDKKAADYAYKKNLQMWNLQNAYNDPAAQMARLQAAGLNPNLVYGGGNVTGNAASSGPEYKLNGNYYEDRSVQRQQLQMAMRDHQQRITNQAIENDLARQRLILAEREADRQDRLADAQIAAYKSSLGFKGAEVDNMLFSQNQARRNEAWQRYKHDADAYDKAAKELNSSYSLGFSKFGGSFKLSGKQAAAQREVVKKLGFRPVYRDYLNGLK